jgi:hypothetical protein
MNVEIGTEAAQFPEKKYVNGIAVAVHNRSMDTRKTMEIDIQSLFGLHWHSCTHLLRPRNPLPPPLALGLIYEGVNGQPR